MNTSPSSIEPLEARIAPAAVTVNGDWVASSLVAGVKDLDNDGFGSADDAVIAGGAIGKIASIRIGGAVFGTSGTGDHFACVARSIGTFPSRGFTAPLPAGHDAPMELAPATSDVTIREI